MKHKASCAVYDPCPSTCDCGAPTDYQRGFQAGAASRDAEVAQWQNIIDEEAKDSALVIIERDQLSAQINRLLDAVKVIETDSEEVLDFDECTAMCVPMDSYHDLVDAAEATPEQSLAEYRNKVIDDVERYRWLRGYMASERTDLDDEIVEACSTDKPEKLDAFIDTAIRAMKE